MTDYQKLRNIIDEIDTLISANVTAGDPQFTAWNAKTQCFLSNKYGKESAELSEFNKIHFHVGIYGDKTPKFVFIEKCKKGLITAKLELSNLMAELTDESYCETVDVIAGTLAAASRKFSKVFIVHGHDGELKEAVARLVEKQGLKPIILNEQANQGKTIIEKFESNSDVGAAIMLFTADDLGKACSGGEEHYRARQNVVFEAGYFMAKLGRDHTIILADPGVEIPSDLQGVVYTGTGTWKFGVLKELKAIGYSIDYNKLDE